MPVTRSSSSKPSVRPSAFSPHRRNPDTEDYKSNKGSPSKPKPKNKQFGKARAKPLIPPGEVFEISSEEESSQPYSTIADLQAKVKMLQKENASLKTARKLEVDKKVVLDISQVEDFISCEICTLKLWQPFILPGCGHTFCQTCLVGWFDKTLAQHVAKHPSYNPNLVHELDGLPAPLRDLLTANGLSAQMQMHIQRFYPQFQLLAPMPQYTCPTCREQVKSKPVEDYALKSLVRTIAGAAGESSPKKSSGKSKSVVKRGETCWDAFFRSAV